MPSRPQRTCVGCRTTTDDAELLRVTVPPAARPTPGQPAGTGDGTGEGAGTGAAVGLVPDPWRRLGGRGAWVHPDPRCLDLAERRRAFGRALRLRSPVDLSAVREAVPASPGASPGDPPATTAGTPSRAGSRGAGNKRDAARR